ncbi:unnamed protein product [Rotaria sp. Silwood2]|nr:unnamed protein product [Rotaria sp. Silwood2]
MIRTPYSRGKLSTLHLTGVHDYIEQGRLYQANHDANGCSPSDNRNKTSDTPEPLNHTVCASVVETTTKPNEYSTRLSNPRASVLTISNDLICTPPNSNNNRQAISQRTTKMLVICSTTFLLLNSPYSAVLLYSIISKHVLTSTLGILRHFYFMSFCLNFFLYSLWGNRFRQEFILLLKSCCTFFVIKYKYTSKAIFQYVPTTIIDQTALNITADVNFYQSKSPCNQSFVKLQNLIINSFQHDSIHMDIKQLEKAIFQIFIETSNILQNTTQDIIFLNDYYNNSNQYRQIKTVRTNDGQFIGNSLFANYVFNKLVPPTKTTCETIININEKKLEKSTCISTTAILLTINRQISFDSKLDNQTFILTSKNLTSTQLKTTTKTDFDQLLKQICAKYELNLQYQLINMMNNELHDEDLNKILEFFSLTWDRYIKKELFHFHGLIQTKLLRRRRFIDYEYNWNLASFRFWTFDSGLRLFSFDPIEFNLNLTNDYLWYGKWAIDFYLKLSNNRQLIRFNHKYHYTTLRSNLLFDLQLINSHYDLDFNYYHSNYSIQGQLIKNKHKHSINGYWNTTANILQLDTEQMKSMTLITSTFIKSIIDIHHQKIGVLIEHTTNNFTNDTQIIECNPYLIIQIRPRLFVIHYYTLNDDLSTMMFEWSTFSYLSWNYTGHGRRIIPITKFEIDIRTKYIFHLHTSTFKYSSIYNNKKRQLVIRREPIAEDADDRYIFKMKFHSNRTFLIHLQVLNNHYELIGDPFDENFHWKLHGYFQRDRFNGSLSVSNNDWWLSSKLNFNSSFYISTGRYVQLISTSDPQIAFEFLLKSRLHFAFQYSELLPLQMSSFNFVRGRSFRIGYQTKQKELILSGNLAFTIEDIYKKQIIIMNERWKLIYGNKKRDKIYIKWNLRIDLNNKTLQGQINIQDPNDEMSIPVYSDINGHLKDMMIVTTMRTIYSSSDNSPKPIILELSIDQRILTQQYFSIKLIHEPSKTNLSLTIDHHPRRKLHIRLKPNRFSNEKTFMHLYANTTESQLKLLLILANLINFNLTLPKSYPETGLLHSSLFIENEEYFDGRLDTTALILRSKKYTCNIKLDQLILQKKSPEQILASIYSRWIERNSTTALITIFSKTDFKRKSIPIWQSAEQKTWLQRFQQFLFANNLTYQFSKDFQTFFKYLKTDFIDEHEQFGIQLMNYMDLDEDLKLQLQQINYTTMVLIETLFQIGFHTENLLQEYMNKYAYHCKELSDKMAILHLKCHLYHFVK